MSTGETSLKPEVQAAETLPSQFSPSGSPANHQLLRSREALVRERGELPRVFAIVRWGCAATGWLAKALNAHPEILSLHHLRARAGLILPQFDLVSDVELVTMMRILGAGYSLVGDVHGISKQSVAALNAAFSDEFRAACLIREPMARLRSQYSHFKNTSFDIASQHDLSYVTRLPGFESIRSLVEDRVERICFVHSTDLLNTVRDEVKALSRFFKYEEVTSNPNAFIDVVDYIFAGTVAASKDFANAAINGARMNPHRRGDEDKTFDEWQMQIVRAIVRPETWQIYSDFGYERPEFLRGN